MSAVLQNLDQLEAALASLGPGAAVYHDVVERTRTHLTRFADLEKRVLGAVFVPVSRHQLSGEGGVEDLAREERRRLGREHPDAEDIMHLLDREGLKVYRPVFPPGGNLLGFFLFDGDVGPSLVADARLGTGRANVVFARLFGHYLLDNDPYRIRLVLEEASAEAEGSADRFAAAFLIDVDELGRYLAALRWNRERDLTGEEVSQLAAFFEVPESAVFQRLAALGIPASVPDRTPEAEVSEAPGEPVISERFVRMALEAHARGSLDPKELALYLETDDKTARALAGRFQLPDPEGHS